MSNYPTPHIKATPDDIAKTVLMPGDPLRSEFVAKNFLENAKLFNNVRGVNGYTGFYKGERVSVMASGMGIPSIGIYSYELYSFFGVEEFPLKPHIPHNPHKERSPVPTGYKGKRIRLHFGALSS